jgi:hypothetical protein
MEGDILCHLNTNTCILTCNVQRIATKTIKKTHKPQVSQFNNGLARDIVRFFG